MASLYAEARSHGILLELCADDAESARNGGRTLADIDFTRDEVKMQPSAVRVGNDALCAQNEAVLFLVLQIVQNSVQFVFAKLLGRFCAPACKDLVCMMMMLVLAVAVTALAVLPMFMVIFMLMVMFMLMMMLVLVMAMSALTMLIMVMMVMVVFVFLVAMSAFAVLAVFVVMMLMHHFFQLMR